jgi:hypothetical protein
MFRYLLPYRSNKYLIDIDEIKFQQKLLDLEVELNKNYEPGKYYILNDPDKKEFLFKNLKYNTKKESGIISKFRYSPSGNKTIIRSSFRFSTVFYVFLPLFMIFLSATFYKVNYFYLIGPIIGYLLFCFFLHLEAWVVTEEFKTNFQELLKAKEVQQ